MLALCHGNMMVGRCGVETRQITRDFFVTHRLRAMANSSENGDGRQPPAFIMETRHPA